MESAEPAPSQNRSTMLTVSFRWKTVVPVIVLTALIAGSAGYLLGTKQSTIQHSRKASLQPSGADTSPTLTLIPTSCLQVYRNEKLGFEFKYSNFYNISNETSESISLGQKASNGYITYLTISINPSTFTNYTAYKPCLNEDISEEIYYTQVPCISKGEYWGQKDDIMDTKLDGVSAKSFYLTEGLPDVHYHIIQTSSSPFVEAKMFVAGGGLESSFESILSTFKFIRR
jgi:hypothetical protein